jgi:hypothetical protein
MDIKGIEKQLIEGNASVMEIDGGLTREDSENKARGSITPGGLVADQEDLPKATASELEMKTETSALPELEISNRFLIDFTAGAKSVTDACPIFIQYAGLGLLSSLLHKSYFYAPCVTHLNLFQFMLGPSSAPRKTTIINMILSYLSEVAPELILPSEMTPEGLITCLSKQSHGVIFSSELNHFLDQVLGPDYNKGLSSTLGRIYDGGPGVSRFTKKDGFLNVQDPALTIVGAGVDEFLIPKIKKIDLVSGFWPRVTLVRVKDYPTKPWQAPGRFITLPHILERLKEINAIEGGEISYSRIESEIGLYADSLSAEAKSFENPNLVAAYLRLQWILIKIAAILQLADYPGSRFIEKDALLDAVVFTDYVKQGLPDFYIERLKESDEVKIARHIERLIDKMQQGESWIPWRKILQNLHCKSSEAQAAMNRLLAVGNHEEITIPATNRGGRPGKAYRRIR